MPSLFNRTNWGRIRLTGADRVRFLHNQTTNNIEQLSAGEGAHTVFVTSTGRTIDLATVYAFTDALLIVVSPGRAQQIYEWMDRYIFFSDKVTLTDESDQTFMFTLLGEDAIATVEQLTRHQPDAAPISDQPFTHQTLSLPETTAPVTLAAGTDLAMAGYTLWGNQTDRKAVESLLLAAGATAEPSSDWEALRIQQGRPMPGAELTEDDNPLESGLWDAISFEKGCYIGQETIARLNTYKGVKKKLWGFQSQTPIPLEGNLSDLVITVEGEKAGRITSLSPSGEFGLGYVRTKMGGEDLDISIAGSFGTIQAKTRSVPFIRHEYYTAASN